jgi:undecaprenyl-diphosphatase
MALVRVQPTRIDTEIASEISAQTTPGMEEAAQALTWGADEHVLLALAAAGWLYAQVRRPAARPLANHMLTVSVVTTILPHILKSVFDQIRPDRLTLRGHVHGIPVSGQSFDAFPSGHAVHMGAVASATGVLPRGPRRALRALAIGLCLTRVALLAHWASDVVAGFALGAAIERLLRPRSLARQRPRARP